MFEIIESKHGSRKVWFVVGKIWFEKTGQEDYSRHFFSKKEAIAWKAVMEEGEIQGKKLAAERTMARLEQVLAYGIVRRARIVQQLSFAF